MSSGSFLKSWTHDGGSATANGSLKARELGLMERMDALLCAAAPDPAKSFIERVTGQSTPLMTGPAPAGDCHTCAHSDAAPDITPDDSALVDLDRRINRLWG